MVKKLMILPDEVRRKETIDLGTIPVNTYSRTLGDEITRGTVSPEEAIAIWRDMVVIREFESMLDHIKKLGNYQGLAYDHKGPAHLSIGQEAAAVGEAFLLGPEVHIFGSHRSHGEIIAKGLSAIRKMEAGELETIMADYLDGEILGIVQKHGQPGLDGRDLAVEFLLYGLLAEVFGRKTGVQRGMGGSMHAFFTPLGIYPNNAIVGGSADIATGAALYKKVQAEPGFTIANIGDASTGCGPVWEAMNFATMGQLWSLWEKDYRGGLKIIFAFMNNFYGMGGQTRGETMGFERLATIAAGLNQHNLHAETIDGNNPLAVIDAFRRKIDILEQGDGPVLLDINTYRQSGHSPSDASAYREREEIKSWRDVDPIDEMGRQLVDFSLIDEDGLKGIRNDISAQMKRICAMAIDLEISPRFDVTADPDCISRFHFSNESVTELPGIGPDDVNRPLEENSRVIALKKKSRRGFDFKTGERFPENRAISIRDGLFEAIIHHFYNDHRLIAYGEENRDWDGAFAVYRGMTESLPYRRLFNSPISEAAIVGSAVGYALEGGRALVELMYADFMGRAGDEIFNQMAKWQGMSAGLLKMPVVLRVSVGNKYGAQHSQDWSALVAHIPGLKVVFPATARDAKGLMAAALSSEDPVVFFESQKIYGQTEWFHPEGVPAEYFTIPIGEPDVKREGSDVTILTIGASLYPALEAAETLQKAHGLSAELIDARSLVPFDYEKVIASVRKTGRIVLVADACTRGSYLNTMATNISQLAFDDLDAPVAVIGARNWITPPAELEKTFFPQADWIIDTIHHQLLPLEGHTPRYDRSEEAILRMEREGI